MASPKRSSPRDPFVPVRYRLPQSAFSAENCVGVCNDYRIRNNPRVEARLLHRFERLLFAPRTKVEAPGDISCCGGSPQTGIAMDEELGFRRGAAMRAQPIDEGLDAQVAPGGAHRGVLIGGAGRFQMGDTFLKRRRDIRWRGSNPKGNGPARQKSPGSGSRSTRLPVRAGCENFPCRFFPFAPAHASESVLRKKRRSSSSTDPLFPV